MYKGMYKKIYLFIFVSSFQSRPTRFLATTKKKRKKEDHLSLLDRFGKLANRRQKRKKKGIDKRERKLFITPSPVHLDSKSATTIFDGRRQKGIDKEGGI